VCGQVNPSIVDQLESHGDDDDDDDVCGQVNPSIVDQLESHGMTFVGHDGDAQRMEIMELQGSLLSVQC